MLWRPVVIENCVYRIVAGPGHIPQVEVWSGNSWVRSSLHVSDVLHARRAGAEELSAAGICSKDAA